MSKGAWPSRFEGRPCSSRRLRLTTPRRMRRSHRPSISRLSMGELADFSGAKYDGDFSLSLEEAQRRKHEYVAEQVGIGPGKRILDLGCGWGALLNFIRNRGGTGIG